MPSDPQEAARVYAQVSQSEMQMSFDRAVVQQGDEVAVSRRQQRA